MGPTVLYNHPISYYTYVYSAYFNGNVSDILYIDKHPMYFYKIKYNVHEIDCYNDMMRASYFL